MKSCVLPHYNWLASRALRRYQHSRVQDHLLITPPQLSFGILVTHLQGHGHDTDERPSVRRIHRKLLLLSFPWGSARG